MEIRTNQKVHWTTLVEAESASESRSFQSHLARASLFEQDEEPFQQWLRSFVAQDASRAADQIAADKLEASDRSVDSKPLESKGSRANKAEESYWRADRPHRVVSRSSPVASSPVTSYSVVSNSALEQTGECTEPMIRSGARSMFGNCAPLALVVDARAQERRAEGCIIPSADGWNEEGCYDGAVASRDDAVRILQLLEHHQSLWLTTPENLPLHLPRLPG
ncbi:hypothetical protein SH467x_001148 [Pirellulaceae bacterium SH467]